MTTPESDDPSEVVAIEAFAESGQRLVQVLCDHEGCTSVVGRVQASSMGPVLFGTNPDAARHAQLLDRKASEAFAAGKTFFVENAHGPASIAVLLDDPRPGRDLWIMLACRTHGLRWVDTAELRSVAHRRKKKCQVHRAGPPPK